MDDNSEQSLRERKKLKTRALIQKEAFRLFKEQGYNETTVEQIAYSAEVSPSTVFRYFPTKADLVMYDNMDELMIAKFREQPAELNALQTIRNVVVSFLGDSSNDDWVLQVERGRLVQQVPELRAAMFDELARSLKLMKDLFSERKNRSIDDDTILALSGAVFGIIFAAWVGNEDEDWIKYFRERIGTGLDLLENGFNM